MAVSRETRRRLPPGGGPAARLVERCAEMGVGLAPEAAGALVALLDRLALEPQNLTAIEGLEEGLDRHLADSLAALALPEVAGAGAVVDIGSGAGFPGLALALARPAMRVTLVESERRKADWLARASAGLPNVRVVPRRSEDLAREERERHPLAAARALGPAPVALELAAPLVAPAGWVALWRGAPGGPDDAADLAAAARELGLSPRDPVPARPFPGARRAIQLFRKTSPTPPRYPRRPGRAAKRPLGA